MIKFQLFYLSILVYSFNIKHLIYASSSSVYGERDKKKPFSEKDPVDHPIQFYAATKRANELMAHAYSHLFNMPTTGIRFFTAYGPWGRPDMALYKFTENIYKNKKIQIYNKGNHTRDFTYIDDVITGIMKCLGNIPKRNNKKKILKNPSESNAPFRIINIGNGKSIQLKDYIKLIEYNLRKKAKKIFLDKQKGDVKDTWADTKKLQTVLKYKTNISAKKGVKSFVEWYKEYYNKKK